MRNKKRGGLDCAWIPTGFFILVWGLIVKGKVIQLSGLYLRLIESGMALLVNYFGGSFMQRCPRKI